MKPNGEGREYNKNVGKINYGESEVGKWKGRGLRVRNGLFRFPTKL